jgi:hypothetical protein
VGRLKQQFSDQVDFFDLDVDKPETLEVRQKYGLVRRSQYALIDAEGNILQSWAGPLNQDRISADMEVLLKELGAISKK